MKNSILTSVLAFFITSFIYSQGFKTGDIFFISDVKYDNYKHINFPKANFITKKGGITSYKNVIGEKVVITSIKEKRDGKFIATIKLVEPRKFFNSHKYITVDINNAVENKELLKVNT